MSLEQPCACPACAFCQGHGLFVSFVCLHTFCSSVYITFAGLIMCLLLVCLRNLFGWPAHDIGL